MVSTSNTPPVADAGPDQPILHIGTTVQLDGSQSYDPNGDSITYAWTLIAKPATSTAALSGPTSATPTFVADVHGDYRASLMVTDSFGAMSVPDEVLISFENVPPVANAGTNQAVTVGDTVTLDGSGSTDANGDFLTYRWAFTSQPSTSTATLTNDTGVYASFVADAAGIYIVSLVVNDGFVDSTSSTVTIVAVSRQQQVVQTLRAAMDAINALTANVFKNANMRNALTNKINAVVADIDQVLYQDALDKLQDDILAKTDGCAMTGAPDRNDWITMCGSSGQEQVYSLLMQAINILKTLI